MIDIEAVLNEKFPNMKKKQPIHNFLTSLGKTLFHEEEINNFIKHNQYLRGFIFLDKILEHFDFTYQVSAKSLNNIPSEGRLLIVANHPIGSLDGLALLKLIRMVRVDVRIVANELLCQVEPLKDLFLAVDNLSKKAFHKNSYQAIQAALERDEAIIIFPAGEVSRIRPSGVRDAKWKAGFLKLSQKTKSPILTIFVNAKNSLLFYSLSTLYKPFGSLLLANEMFNKNSQQVTFNIGKPVHWKVIEEENIPLKALAQRFRKHLYRLAKKGKKSLFKTFVTIAHPVDPKILKKRLYKDSELLGVTDDSKKIFLYDYKSDSPVIQEIGRLRELTFRTVEEGTGTSLDIDKYDTYYRHIILWDDINLDIVGAYRIGECDQIVKKYGMDGFYTNTLFKLTPYIDSYLPNALELGRSFIQPKYWGRRSLDYLWHGIGAYLHKNQHIKYLFGPVSISNAYPNAAKEMILAFYANRFASGKPLAIARNPFKIPDEIQILAQREFSDDYKSSFKKLNEKLSKIGIKVPTLYKQYVELCDDTGCSFVDFNIDPLFNDCIDSLIFIEVDKIKPKKRQRYINSK